MRLLIASVPSQLLVLALVLAPPVFAASDAESDALSLQSDTSAPVKAASDTKFFVEGAIGDASQRYQLGSNGLHRASFDLSHTARLGPG